MSLVFLLTYFPAPARRSWTVLLGLGPGAGAHHGGRGLRDADHPYVPAWRLDAPGRQHAVPVDLRRQSRGARWAMSAFCLLPCRRAGGGGAADGCPIPIRRVPMVGASGAIAGVMGGYLLLLSPGAGRCAGDHHRLLPHLRHAAPGSCWASGSAIQIFSGCPRLGGCGGVAYWAHVGGFVAGLVLDPAGLAAAGRARLLAADRGPAAASPPRLSA
jgi:hypothetical protein